ncbi:MAG: hypothetical protein ACI4B4_10230, partial [Segatella copri]
SRVAQIFVSGVAHFFVVVGGSKIHERLAHFFIDIYNPPCYQCSPSAAVLGFSPDGHFLLVCVSFWS